MIESEDVFAVQDEAARNVAATWEHVSKAEAGTDAVETPEVGKLMTDDMRARQKKLMRPSTV